MSAEVKRCKQCGKIIVEESALGLCPKCADEDARTAAELGLVLVSVGLIAKRLWKPGVNLVNGIVKVITKA